MDFFTFEETGKLIVEKVIFDAGYPVLFTCVNNENDLYLVVCCQSEQSRSKWLLAETTPETVVKLLRNEITIREAFLIDKRKRFSVLQEGNRISLVENDLEDWDAEKSIYLPDAGEYMDAEPGEFEDEINFYRKRPSIDFSIEWKDMMQIDYTVTSKKEVDAQLMRRMNAYKEQFEMIIAVSDLPKAKVYFGKSSHQYAA